MCVKYPHHIAEGAEAEQGDSLSGVCSAVVVPQAGNEGSVPCCGVTFRVWEARRGCRNLRANSKVPKAEKQLLLSFQKRKCVYFVMCFLILSILFGYFKLLIVLS